MKRSAYRILRKVYLCIFIFIEAVFCMRFLYGSSAAEIRAGKAFIYSDNKPGGVPYEYLVNTDSPYLRLCSVTVYSGVPYEYLANARGRISGSFAELMPCQLAGYLDYDMAHEPETAGKISEWFLFRNFI